MRELGHPPPVRLRRWGNLGLVAIGALYVVFTIAILQVTGLFTYVGIDYRALWCSLRFARAMGFEHLYDPAMQAQFHQGFDPSASGYVACNTPPAPYLPAFMALFEPLALLPAPPGFVLWTLLQVRVVAFVCYRLATTLGSGTGVRPLLRFFLAFALFHNLVVGQVNTWLLLCFAECLIAYRRGHGWLAGAWLAGLLLKPQILLLILPGLAIRRELKMLLGFGAASLCLLLASLALVGVDGMLGLVRLIQYYSGGPPPSFPEAGMNWRGLAINLTPLVGAPAAWAVALPGLLLTVAAGLAVWLAPQRPRSADGFAIALLGSFAATSATTWHSHVYSALPLLAPLIYLGLQGKLPEGLVYAWIALPAVAFFGATLFNVAFGAMDGLGHPAAGVTMLLVNVALVVWAVRALWRPPATVAPREPLSSTVPAETSP